MGKRGLVKLAAATAGVTLWCSMAAAVTVAPPPPAPPYPTPTPVPRSTSVPSGPYSTFQFSGACTDCTDSGTPELVTGQLVLSNYILGAPINTYNFYSFTYNGSDALGPYTIYSTNVSALGGSIDNPSGFENFYVSGFSASSYYFETANTGQWDTGRIVSADTGLIGSFTLVGAASPVPETATWALLILGLGAVGMRARHRRRSVAATYA